MENTNIAEISFITHHKKIA